MPVKHDLSKDLELSKEEIIKRRAVDMQLSRLLDRYDEVDAQVLSAEAGASGGINDDELKKLKEKRLLLKDKIVQQLADPKPH